MDFAGFALFGTKLKGFIHCSMKVGLDALGIGIPRSLTIALMNMTFP